MLSSEPNRELLILVGRTSARWGGANYPAVQGLLVLTRGAREQPEDQERLALK